MPSRKEKGFSRYQHIERQGTPLVEDIEMGTVYVFPKLDGANGSVWLDSTDGRVRAGSRNRPLELDNDNQGFYAHVLEPSNQTAYVELFYTKPNWHLFGEWLVPHTMKTYRDDTWRRFYLFDVFDHGSRRWVPYDEYASVIVDEMGITAFDVIPPLSVIDFPTESDLAHVRDNQNTYLMKDEAGVGEGVVLKNYAFFNRFGRQVWAKMVRTEFKDENRRTFGHLTKEGEIDAAVQIVKRCVTPELVAKERAKIEAVLVAAKFTHIADVPEVDREEYLLSRECRKKLIPRLLGTVFYCLVHEELWNEIKRLKNPTVDFKRLNAITIAKVKEFSTDLFGGVS